MRTFRRLSSWLLFGMAGAISLASQNGIGIRTGAIAGRLSREGRNEGIEQVLVTLEGPRLTLDNEDLRNFYIPNARLTPEMRRQIAALVEGAAPSLSLQAVANGARRMEAVLLGLPSPEAIPLPTAALPPRQAVTDADGRFSFKELAPGRYTIHAKPYLEAYFAAPGRGPQATSPPATITAVVEVRAGNTADASMSMIRGGVISGRLLDANGSAVPNLFVAAYRKVYDVDGGAALEAVKAAQTDDRGDYRLFWLPPGEYWIGLRLGGRGDTSSVDELLTYRDAFHSNATDPRAVPPLTVGEGAELTGINIIPLPRTDASAKISGRILSPPGKGPEAPALDVNRIVLLNRDSKLWVRGRGMLFQNESQNHANGEFEIRNVPAGSYDLLVSDPGNCLRGRTRVEVGTDPVEDIAVKMAPCAEVRVRIVVDGQPMEIPAAGPTRGTAPTEPATTPRPLRLVGPSRPTVGVRLRSGEYTPFETTASRDASLDSSGLFVFPNVPPARYFLAVSALRAGGYVEDIRRAGFSIFDEGLLVTDSSPVELTVAFNTKGGSVKGRVTGSDEKPFVGAAIAIVPPLSRRQNAALYRTATSDDAGAFSVSGIAPGEYKVFAWESVPTNAWKNADFMLLHEHRGVAVTITAGATSNVDLRVISRE